MHTYLALGVIITLLTLMYVAPRLGGNVDNRIYSPRKQSFLDRLEGIEIPDIPKLKPHREKTMSIGDHAMQQLKALAMNDALGVNHGFRDSRVGVWGDEPEALRQLRELANSDDLSTNLDATLDSFNSTSRNVKGSVDVDQMAALTEEDQVNAPSHYMLWPDTEVIDLIRKVLTEDELRGWYKGNSLKYRLRLGAKDNTEQDLAKAEKFEQWLGDLH
jgi:hypothetical protein